MKLQLIGLLILVMTGQAAAKDKAKTTQKEAIAAIKKLGGCPGPTTLTYTVAQ